MALSQGVVGIFRTIRAGFAMNVNRAFICLSMVGQPFGQIRKFDATASQLIERDDAWVEAIRQE